MWLGPVRGQAISSKGSDMSARRYRLAGPNFASEVIAGEAIIINLEKGSYYSLPEAGAGIWAALTNGSSDSEVLGDLLRRYSGDAGSIQAALHELITQLEAEGILTPEDGAGPAEPILAGERDPSSPAFTPPVLQKYTDMEAILMLDPIHEVDETGWPSARP